MRPATPSPESPRAQATFAWLRTLVANSSGHKLLGLPEQRVGRAGRASVNGVRRLHQAPESCGEVENVMR